MTGIVLCAVALALALAALVLRLLPTERPHLWSVALIASTILIAVALLWGNIGVIYSHAGLTG